MVPVERPKTNKKFASREKIRKWKTGFINIAGFTTVRRDRPNDNRGGGLCTFINPIINFIELHELNDSDIESQWFLLRPDRLPRGINSIILGLVYHPPQNSDRDLKTR
jgi:hypothetical protein